MEFLQDLFSLMGRVLIGGVFLWAAYEKITHWSTTLAYMKARNVPYMDVVVPTSVGLKIAGALSLVLGWHAHLGAFVLLLITAASAIYLHDFWTKQGSDRNLEKLFFMKELAVIGGLFMILALGGGHFGLG